MKKYEIIYTKCAHNDTCWFFSPYQSEIVEANSKKEAIEDCKDRCYFVIRCREYKYTPETEPDNYNDYLCWNEEETMYEYVCPTCGARLLLGERIKKHIIKTDGFISCPECEKEIESRYQSEKNLTYWGEVEHILNDERRK